MMGKDVLYAYIIDISLSDKCQRLYTYVFYFATHISILSCLQDLDINFLVIRGRIERFDQEF